jgi:tetratricopeptide (TPR) repeat protein
MYPLPLTQAYPVSSYLMNPYRIVVFTDCAGIGAVEYIHVMLVYREDEMQPCFAVAAEVNQLAQHLGSGSHFLCTYDERHNNLGSSNDWANLETFIRKGLDIVAERFNVSPPQQSTSGSGNPRNTTEDRAIPLRYALAAYQQTLGYAPTSHIPFIQFNLGNTYSDLSLLEDQAGNLHKAVTAYQEALRSFTPPSSAYALTQRNLGHTYLDLSTIEDPLSNLRHAIAAYQESLGGDRQESASGNDAMTHIKLGIAYFKLAGLEDRGKNLRCAIAAYQEALRYIIPQRDPVSYAGTQNNLGLAYRALAAIEDHERNMRYATDAFQKAARYHRP